MSLKTPLKLKATIIDGKVVMVKAGLPEKNVALPNSHNNQVKYQTNVSKHDRIRKNREIIALLSSSFPATFDLKDRRPLKIGIKSELLPWAKEFGISEKCLSSALKYYVSGRSYLKATLDSSHRVDLQGETVEEVDQKSRDHALKTLKGLSRLKDKLKSPDLFLISKGKQRN